MTTTPFCPAPPRDKIPKDGPGPRGVPDCYYISRTLNSTFRYARFVKKMRAKEAKALICLEKLQQNEKDKQTSEFLYKNQRRGLINFVSKRVDICLQAYERDVEEKRNRLRAIIAEAEEKNIRKIIMQVQDVRKAMWQEKLDRLQVLLDKRRKEHEEKYKNRPVSSCTHVQPCIVNRHTEEAHEIHVYQMHENQSRKMQEKEFDKMWLEISMKESDALEARLEIDAMNRYRQDMECKKYNDMLIAQREKQREIDRETLKKEQLALKAKFEEDTRKAKQEERERHENIMEATRALSESTENNWALAAKKAADDALVEGIRNSLANQGKADEEAKLELMRTKRKELNACNMKLLQLRDALINNHDEDQLVDELNRQKQEINDRKHCNYVLGMQKAKEESRKVMKEQIAENAKTREDIKKKIAVELQYRADLQKQMDQLIAYKLMDEAKTRKIHQQDLVKQMQYSQLLKERALQEEMEQRKKAAIAAKEYQDEINAILSRQYLTDHVHPFLKQMETAGMIKQCTCSKPVDDFCRKPRLE